MAENKIKQSKFGASGFTLVEMIVAVAVFAVAALALLNIYMINNATQRKIAAISLVTVEARYALETMTRATRTGAIDYSYYSDGTVSNIQNELAIEDSGGNNIVFKMGVSGDGYCSDRGDCILYKIGSIDWTPLTSDDVEATRLDFYIYPPQNPLLTGASLPAQPRVTMVFTLRNITVKTAERKVIELQTTVSSRVYKR
ncbi:prepilin-type N-terminal cleavage/methylation domain-containing protein [Patescibacteria group bacterium]|nr:prepilin-type N-terminal cleavage/methylation domain-containing protein [Patescibacteria group bacterium]MBU4512291.1 prepilin-type N-terminal cleavage/methylation domain-containing protein [Patescibacteria group bacterium]MCG2693645.1 prepilin-type N-terminal cleavage/methylation domain-containing protein [Candidatus Parcubacteria bacterium]